MAAAKKTKKATKLPKGYVPSDDEKFMNAKQREYFRQKLLAWKADIYEQNKDTVAYLQQENVTYPDPADTASANACLLYTSPSPRDKRQSRMPSSA